jgi:Uma2 family endonuclease
MTYLEGELELMSPSVYHEISKTQLGRLVEAYADALDIELIGAGSWTIKQRRTERGAEPDECYIVGNRRPAAPDLAIEVIWTSGGIDKLEVYRGLGVREVWIWEDNRLNVYRLRRGKYDLVDRSVVLPLFDLRLIARFAVHPNQARAVKELRAALKRRKTSRSRSI